MTRMVLMLVALVGCGTATPSAKEGGSCTSPSAVECASTTRLLVCEGTTWLGYACPSCAAGKCDWKGAATGDGCPKLAEGYGTCPYNGRLVGCYWSATADAGVFVESACGACVAGKSIEELGKCSGGHCSCQ